MKKWDRNESVLYRNYTAEKEQVIYKQTLNG
jgi:hypothetical protein